MIAAFETWAGFFDDDYRKLYSEHLHPIRTEFEVRSLVKLLKLTPGERILDLCCGDGRHTVPLQQRGFNCTGIDLADPMLQGAKARSRRAITGDAAPPQWIPADACRLPLRPVFDAVVMLYNSIPFGPKETTQALLRSARSALRPGGRLLVECMHRDLEARTALVGEDIETVDGPSGPVTIERGFNPLLGEQYAKMTFTDAAGAAREKVLRYLVYTAGELRELLHGAGFPQVELLGGYDGRAFGIDTPAILLAGIQERIQRQRLERAVANAPPALFAT